MNNHVAATYAILCGLAGHQNVPNGIGSDSARLTGTPAEDTGVYARVVTS
jgi:hypothetical protein